ncbi:MAG: hypothetical protein FVQ77_04290 [Cytophagales bacterium]|nr:hypothetical protein [Cytophagales bacterium]
MEVKKFDDIELYQWADEIQKIGNEAVNQVLKENREKGIPIVFSENGIIYYELPGGEITTVSPFTGNDDKGEKSK